MSSHKPDTKTNILNATWRLMELKRGQGVSMSSIAKQAGISRQALYLHFESRTELMIATVNHVDDVKMLSENLQQFRAAKTGLAQLEAYIEVWGNHMPEIFGLAKALLSTKETDEATAAAWQGRMQHLKNYCTQIIESLQQDGMLATHWSTTEAAELFWTMTSIQNWEQLTIECGWSNEQYIQRMTRLLKHTFVT